MTEKLRILFLTMDFINPIFSGNGTLSRTQILNLVKRGHKIMVICPEGELESDSEAMDKIKIGNLIVNSVEINSSKDLSINSDWQGFNEKCIQEEKIIRKFKPNIIMSIDWHTIDSAIQLKKDLGIPLLVQFFRIFTYFPEYFKNNEEFNIIREKEILMLKNADVSCVLCKIDRKWAIEHGAKKTEILYPPVQDGFLNVLRDFEMSHLNRKNNIKIDSEDSKQTSVAVKKKIYKLMTIARVVPEKKIHRIIPILTSLKKRGFRFTYHLAGEKLDLAYWKLLQEKIKEYSLEDNVEFSERILLDNIIPFYKNYDCYIHTSSYEPFGISIIEAALTGCPIFLDEKGLIGASEILIKLNGKNLNEIENGAFLIDYDKPEESAEKMAIILQNSDLLEKTAQLAKTYAKKLNTEKYITNLIQILKAL